ncbi:transposase [Mesorhizobium sp. M0698]
MRRGGRTLPVGVIIAFDVNTNGQRSALGMAIDHLRGRTIWTESLCKLS